MINVAAEGKPKLDHLLKGWRNLVIDPLPKLRVIVDKWAKDIQTSAQKRTPHKTGTLRGSASNETNQQGRALIASVLFGGLASEYAEYQHEHTELDHDPPEFHGGQAHFLHGGIDNPEGDPTAAWNDVIAAQMAEAVADALRRAFEGTK